MTGDGHGELSRTQRAFHGLTRIPRDEFWDELSSVQRFFHGAIGLPLFGEWILLVILGVVPAAVFWLFFLLLVVNRSMDEALLFVPVYAAIASAVVWVSSMQRWLRIRATFPWPLSFIPVTFLLYPVGVIGTLAAVAMTIRLIVT